MRIVRFHAVVVAALCGLLICAGAAAAKRPFPGPGGHHKSVCGPVGNGFARCLADVVTNASGTPLNVAATPNTNPGGYWPADLQSAYNLATAASQSGSGQTVAIVDAYDDPKAESDLAAYRNRFYPSLPPCDSTSGCFKKVNQSGGTALPKADSGWAQEISLDLDMVSAICPHCHILLVEASSASYANLGAAVNTAVNLHATEVSNSYGGSEYPSWYKSFGYNYQLLYGNVDKNYNHPGVAITASSGDSGYGVQFPASSRYVTAVGGTTLNSQPWSQKAWSGAGSGCSAWMTKPQWQTGIGCPNNRTVADVSAVADPNTGVAVYDSYNQSGWLVFGGTSVASPIIASVYALAGNAATATSVNSDGSGGYGSFPYAHATSLFDVTFGNNGSCGGSPLCTAGPGYDGPTGLGTPDGTGTPNRTGPPNGTDGF